MLIRTYADIESLKGNAALSPAEKKLIERCKRGELTILGNGTRPKRPSKARTIRADLLRYLILGGCEQCRVHEKGVQLMGAWIEGQLDLSFASAKGAVHLLRSAFAMPLIAYQASLDRLVLNGSSLPGFNAQGAAIKGDVFIRELETTGEVSLSGTEIGGQLLGNGAELNGGDGDALNMQGAMIRGGAFLNNLKSSGEVSFVGAEIGGQFSAIDAELTGGQGNALNAQGATIRGGAFLDNLKSTGEVSFAGAEIDGQLSGDAAELNGGRSMALNAQGAMIRGGAFLRKLKSTGEVSFLGAEIGVQLSLKGASLNGGKGDALNAQRLIVRGSLFWQSMETVVGSVDLNAGQLSDLVDDEQSWHPETSLRLVGLTYENLVGTLDLSFRKRWLKQGASVNEQFHPQPYQQLAKFYRETGHRYEAREILVAKEIEQRKATRKAIREGKARTESWLHPKVLSALNFLWDWTTRLIAGYGYKPWLSLWWLAGMIGIVWTVAFFTWNAGDFAPNSAIVLTSAEWKAEADLPEVYSSLSEHEKQMIAEDMTPAHPWSNFDAPGKDYETFYSFAYALDVVVPVLDLGQTDAWAPSPARGGWGYWMFYAQKMFIVLGWVVTAIAAAAISGMIRRDD